MPRKRKERERDPQSSRTSRRRATRPDEISDEEYEVERIIDMKIVSGKPKYHVKWKGYNDTTWEPESNLTCPRLLQQFNEEQLKRARASKKKAASPKATASSESSVKRKASKGTSQEKEYEVEAILRERFRFGLPHYLVKWKGYTECSWIAGSNMNCPEVLAVFRRRQQKAHPAASIQVSVANVTENHSTTNSTTVPVATPTDINQDARTLDPSPNRIDRSQRIVSNADELRGVQENSNPNYEFDFPDYREENTNDEETKVDEEARSETNSSNLFRKKRPTVSHSRPKSLLKAPRTRPFRIDVANEGLDDDHEFLASDYCASESDDGSDEETTENIIVNEEDDEDEFSVETAEEIRAVAGPQDYITDEMLRSMSINGWEELNVGDGVDDTNTDGMCDVMNDPPHLQQSAIDAARTMKPTDLFFYFMPKRLWRDIAHETNLYERQTRAQRLQAASLVINAKTNDQALRSKLYREKERALDSFKEISAAEITHFLALIISRAVCPIKARMEDHWKTQARGAIPAGTWSPFMPRLRFKEINRFIHFTDNEDPRAKSDRAWKIRSVIDTLQDTFKGAMELGRWVAFDEMVIPSRSSRNTIRVFLKNKPHKYGTKLFAVCCGETHYCSRFEVYCGKKQDSQFVDTRSGPMAVVRNLKALWEQRRVDRSKKRIVVTDREYSSVSLSFRLMDMGYYNIGTVSTSRLGFVENFKTKKRANHAICLEGPTSLQETPQTEYCTHQGG